MAQKRVLSESNLHASIIMFFFYASSGAIFPIFNLLFRAKNFSLEQISFLLVIPNLFNLLAGPIWASIADVFNMHKRVLTLAMFLTIPFIVSLSFIDEYFLAIVFFSLFAFSFAPLMTMTDNAVLGLLGNNQFNFGKIRVWGSISFGFSAWLVGWISEKTTISSAYWICALCMLITLFATKKLPDQPALKKVPFGSNFKILLQDNYFLGLLAGALMAGYGQSLIMNYLPPFIKDLGATSANIGLAINISAISEIPIMLLSPLFLNKISFKTLFQISLFATLIRTLGYTFATSVEMIFIIQLLHGLTSSLFWITAVIYARHIAPLKLSATALALLGATYYGLAGILGSFGGGQLYAAFGAIRMFQTGAFLGLLGLIIFSLKTKTFAN